jgi:hypothetical protein
MTLSINTLLVAQQSTDTTSVESPDLRIPSDERLKEISEMKKYSYNEPQKALSFWDKIVITVRRWLRNLLDNVWVEYFLKGSAILIFIVVLIALINQMLKGEIKSAITGKKDRSLLNLNIDDGDLSTNNIDRLIAQALEKKNYGLAVRFLYQKSLLLLKEHELIHFKQDKTNYEYLKELNDHPSASYFDRLTYFHEYIDYGHFEIDKDRYQKVKDVFTKFQNSLNA